MASHPLNSAGFLGADRTARQPLVATWLQLLLRAITTRRELARLDAHLLRDIGVSASSAAREVSRLPWDVR